MAEQTAENARSVDQDKPEVHAQTSVGNISDKATTCHSLSFQIFPHDANLTQRVGKARGFWSVRRRFQTGQPDTWYARCTSGKRETRPLRQIWKITPWDDMGTDDEADPNTEIPGFNDVSVNSHGHKSKRRTPNMEASHTSQGSEQRKVRTLLAGKMHDADACSTETPLYFLDKKTPTVHASDMQGAVGILKEAEALEHALGTWIHAPAQYGVHEGHNLDVASAGQFPTFRMKPVLGETHMPFDCATLEGGGNAELKA